jgi:anti-anti-sigma regulatory factor
MSVATPTEAPEVVAVAPAATRGPTRPAPTIRSVQPDRHHGVLEVAGALGHDDATELRQRVEGLLVAGVRYLLVDLVEAGPCDPVAIGVLADAARRLEGRQGWLRINPNRTVNIAVELDEVALPELFAIYRASSGTPRPVEFQNSAAAVDLRL